MHDIAKKLKRPPTPNTKHKHTGKGSTAAGSSSAMGRSSSTRQQHSLLGLGGESAARSKFLLFGLCAGLTVVVQVMQTKMGSSLPHPSHGSGRAQTLLQHAQPPLKAPFGEDEQGPEARTQPREPDRSRLPRRAEQDLRSPTQPWPKPLSAAETAFWVDVLGNYTETAPPRRKQKAGGETQKPVNIKTWVEQGHCKHADMYLGLILDRLRPWSQGGISQRMIEEAVRLGKERTDLGSLLYQILDGDVYAKAEGYNLNIDVYARLFLDVLQVLKIPNMEFGVFTGRDLPVMLRHEVHPIFAYASADAFSEMLVPCPWYILPLVEGVGLRPKGWKPLDLEGFRAREGKVYWRGSPNDFVPYEVDNVHFAPRMKLVDESLRHPDLVDAHLSSSLDLLSMLPAEDECRLYQRWNVSTPEGVLPKEGCTDETVEKFRGQHEARQKSDTNETESSSRYGLNIDGTGFSERYAAQLLNDQLIFKVDTPFFNFYSRFFLPYEHYIPVKYDLSDLSEKVAWANEHVEESHRIMTQGARLAHSLFHPDEVFCYTGLALTAFGRLLGYEVSGVPREGVDQLEPED